MRSAFQGDKSGDNGFVLWDKKSSTSLLLVFQNLQTPMYQDIPHTKIYMIDLTGGQHFVVAKSFKNGLIPFAKSYLLTHRCQGKPNIH
jgi:hypothetical protein